MEELFYGIKNTKNEAKAPIVFCNICMKKYYSDVSDERNLNGLKLIYDKKNQEYFKGCPFCETDEFLSNSSLK